MNEENRSIYCKIDANVGLSRRFEGIFNNLCGKSPQMFLNLRIFRNVPRDLGSQDPSFLRVCPWAWSGNINKIVIETNTFCGVEMNLRQKVMSV